MCATHGRDRPDLRYGDTAGGEHVREHGLGLRVLAQLVPVGPDPRQPRLEAPPRLRRTAGQGDEPAAREVAVVGQFLHALRSDGSEHGVRVGRQPLEQGEPVGGEHQHPAHRLGEVAVRQLDQADIAEVAVVAEEREPVLVGHRGAFGERGHDARVRGRGTRQQQPGLAEQVERDVGQRDVLLEVGRPAAPLREAVGQDERVVAEGEAVGGQLGGVDPVRDRRVDSCQRVLEVGAEGPVGVVDQQPGVRAVVVVGLVGVYVRHVLRPHMWGTLSGMS